MSDQRRMSDQRIPDDDVLLPAERRIVDGKRACGIVISQYVAELTSRHSDIGAAVVVM